MSMVAGARGSQDAAPRVKETQNGCRFPD